MANRKSPIGLGQARRLAQIAYDDRLAFIAEGLPLILDSARGLWSAAQKLTDQGREADVLECHAQEEAAKILILLDVVRCPPNLTSSKLGGILRGFYDHLTRLIYAQAVTWRPTNLRELREYVDSERKSHYLEGSIGEFIMPNWTLYQRESQLYVDVEAAEDGEIQWSKPATLHETLPNRMAPALDLIEAMSALGLFSQEGVRIIANVWGNLAFTEQVGCDQSDSRIKETLRRVIEQKVVLPRARQEHVDRLYRNWQMPMYDLDFKPIDVPLEELKAIQERSLWSEMGY